jgi:hypothetical protein
MLIDICKGSRIIIIVVVVAVIIIIIITLSLSWMTIALETKKVQAERECDNKIK